MPVAFMWSSFVLPMQMLPFSSPSTKDAYLNVLELSRTSSSGFQYSANIGMVLALIVDLRQVWSHLFLLKKMSQFSSGTSSHVDSSITSSPIPQKVVN
jgi:hypothetical protein